MEPPGVHPGVGAVASSHVGLVAEAAAEPPSATAVAELVGLGVIAVGKVSDAMDVPELGAFRRALGDLSDLQLQAMAELSGYQGPAARPAWVDYLGSKVDKGGDLSRGVDAL